MPSESKYKTVLNGENGIASETVFKTWQEAMDALIRLGVGRKTSESNTYELDPGVEIKAVRDGV